ncbi:hypothetical protein EVA_00500 [gut metagenome]|uniref:Uncharacterized protein n=1 Tax=gut metagenome TaxID=749906 RepID=J9H441_9ZZZZ
MTLGTNEVKNITLADASQLWRFEGNPWDGYQIINGQSNGLLNACPQVKSGTGENNPVTVNSKESIPAGNVSLWIATASTDRQNGFYLNLKDHESMKMNYRSPNLAFWTGGADGGSTFTVKTELPGLKMAADNQTQKCYASLYLPFNVNLPKGVTAYTATSASASALNMTAIADTVVPRLTGVILVREGNETKDLVLNLAAEKAAPTAVQGNLFEGTLKEDSTTTGVLVLAKPANKEVGFYPLKKGVHIPANRAFLKEAKLQGQKALKLNFDGETTDIELVEGQTLVNKAPIYDLSGRRIMKPAKGSLYIQNGKKFIAQ